MEEEAVSSMAYFCVSIAVKTLVPWTVIQPEGDHTFEELLIKIKVIILAKIVLAY